MTTAFREFKGHEWLGRGIQLPGGTLFLVEDKQFSGIAAAVARAGRKAAVYQGRHNGRVVAVKAFHRAFALMDNLLTTQALRPFQEVPGLAVCDRDVVRADQAAHAGATGLSWSVVMPWIEGDPWAAYVEEKRPVEPSSSLALARHTATILAGLEQRELVHTDISSGNVIVTQLKPRPAVELIDVEDMYHPTFKTPAHVPDGTAGYGHPKNVGKGCWNRNGDRFAASILLVEMLTWHQPAVRAAAADVSLFEQDELCQESRKYHLVRNAVAAHSTRAAELFTQAWRSDGLSTCPPLAEWRAALASAALAQLKQWAPAEALRPPSRRLFGDLLGQERFQTSFVSSVRCDECGAKISGGTPTDHKPTCSHHPRRIDWSGLFADVPKKDEGTSNALRDLMKRYSPGSSLCSECSRFVKGPFDVNHAPGCAASMRLGALKPPPARPAPTTSDIPQFDDITFRPLGGPVPGTPPSLPFSWPTLSPESRWCTDCSRTVKLEGGAETGHALLCPQGTLRRKLGA